MISIEVTNYDDLYGRLFASYPGLVEINAQCVTDVSLDSLTSTTSSKLTSVDLEVIDTATTSVVEAGLCLLFQRSPLLVRISIDGAVYDEDLGDNIGCHATDATIQTLVTHCPLVEMLSLANWYALTDLALTYIASLKHLRGLVLAYCSYLSIEGIVSMLMKCGKNLEVFEFGYIEGSIDDILRCISENCPRLREIVWHADAEFGSVTSAGVLALVQGCPCLERIDSEMYAYNDQVLTAISESCPALRHVDLSTSAEITDLGLIALSKGCPELNQLHISSPAITDEAVLSFAKYCNQLTSIIIQSCNHIHSQSVVTLIEANTTKLELIELRNCIHIGEEAILAAAECCPMLKIFSFIGCQCITQSSLSQLIGSCTSLETLNVSNADITDAFINTLIRRCKYLKNITLHNCPNITERSLVTLLKSTGSLCSVIIFKCNLHASDKLCNYYTTLPSDSDQKPLVKLTRGNKHLPWLPSSPTLDIL